MAVRASTWFRLGLALSLALVPRGAAAQNQDPGAHPTEHALGYEYISPAPGSSQILTSTDVILRPGGVVNAASVGAGLLRAQGTASGGHDGSLRLSDDGRTLTFQPAGPFTPGERVNCAVGPGLETDTQGALSPIVFSFTVAGPERDALAPLPALPEGNDIASSGGSEAVRIDSLPSPPPVPLPADFPLITASVFGSPTPGRLFLCSIDFFRPSSSYLMILENDGTPFFLRRLPGLGLDFKLQPDGRLTYFDNSARCFYALNALYAVVDSFRCGNGYVTDGHDLVLLPNGHALLMSYDPELVDLTPSKMGLGFGIAIGLIVQELDQAKNVVFQWRSWDHFQIADMVGRNSSVGAAIDYVHGNSLDVDPDGNIILSCRSMDEVTKISRTTGEVLWRLGGKNNQFTFLNDPILFSHQHAVRRLPNGHLVLFDNGNSLHPSFSRAVEYAIDEIQKTATLVWQYRLTPDVFAPAFGYVQRFANGNTLIAWGATTPTLTEVAPDGSIVSELTFDTGVDSYRAFRFEWPPVRPALVTFQPASINKGSTGGPISAVVEPGPGAGFTAADILVATVRLNGTVRASAANVVQADANADNVPDVTLQFPREALDPLLSIGVNRLEMSGSLATGEVFRGTAVVKVFTNSSSQLRAGSLHVVSPPGSLPVEIAAGGAQSKARTLVVYDVQGRLVKRWSVAAGSTATWDGFRSDGRRAGAGIYLVRSEDGPPGPAVKVAIVR